MSSTGSRAGIVVTNILLANIGGVALALLTGWLWFFGYIAGAVTTWGMIKLMNLGPGSGTGDE